MQWRKVRVNLRLDVLVPEDHLDVADVGSVLVHVRRHAVPQEMARSDLAGLRGHDVYAHRPREMVAAERFALGGQKHRGVGVFGKDFSAWRHCPNGTSARSSA